MENRKKLLRERAGLKAFITVLASACLFGLIVCVILTVMCFNNKVYFENDHETFRNNTFSRIYRNSQYYFTAKFTDFAYNYNIRLNDEGQYVYDRDALDGWFSDYLPDKSNLIFRVTDEKGDLIYSTLQSDSGVGDIQGYTANEKTEEFEINVISEQKEKLSEIVYSDSDLEYYFTDRLVPLDFCGVITGTVLIESADKNSTGTNNNYIRSEIVLATVDEEGNITRNEREISAFSLGIKNYNEGLYFAFDDFLNPSGTLEQRAKYYTESENDPQNGLPPEPVDRTAVTAVYNGEEEEYAPYIRFEGTVNTLISADAILRSYVSDNPVIGDSIYIGNLTTGIISKYSRLYPVLAIALFFIFITLSIVLCCFSGYRYPDGTASPCWFDKLPIELFFAVIICSVPFILEVYSEFVYRNYYLLTLYNTRLLEIAVYIGILILFPVFIVLTVSTLATRFKCKVFLKYSIIGFLVKLSIKIAVLLAKFIKRAARSAKYLLSVARLSWKVSLAWLLYAFYNVFWLIFNSIYRRDYEAIGIMFIANGGIALLIVLLIWAGGFTKIRQYAKKLANGEFDAKINKNHLRGELLSCAEDLENVGDGIKKAVELRTRSERMKTELITNVSHDLKTPLTSIVNYIDILSKDEIESPEAREHIEVLKRQAARMKKLIEDLVEVSKASSGNITPNFERTDVNLLLTQTLEEYSEKFTSAGLISVINIPEKKMIASLDGRLMWRVLDNIMGNIVKYALSGTRVYITAEEQGSSIRVTYKNISRSPLEVNGEDLTERFVRGDSSRSTEGSGLGLSIAKSLCDIQCVKFEITVDGDLFKVELIIPKTGDEEILYDSPAPTYSAQYSAQYSTQTAPVNESIPMPDVPKVQDTAEEQNQAETIDENAKEDENSD